MKINYLLTPLLVFLHIGLAAQSWSFGGGGIYGDDIENVGVQLRGYYNLPNNKICFGPEFSYFFDKSETINDEKIEKKLWEINFNLHYIIEVSEKWGVYPLTGINISFETEEVNNTDGQIIDEKTAWGANLGFGVHRPIGKWVLFVEYDHLFSTLSQNSYVLGAFITLGKKPRQQNNE